MKDDLIKETLKDLDKKIINTINDCSGDNNHMDTCQGCITLSLIDMEDIEQVVTQKLKVAYKMGYDEALKAENLMPLVEKYIGEKAYERVDKVIHQKCKHEYREFVVPHKETSLNANFYCVHCLEIVTIYNPQPKIKKL